VYLGNRIAFVSSSGDEFSTTRIDHRREAWWLDGGLGLLCLQFYLPLLDGSLLTSASGRGRFLTGQIFLASCF